MKIHLLLAAACLSMAACHNTEEKSATPDFLAANLDTTVNPATDFFQYANGGWIKSTSIPPSESAWGIGQLVQEDIYDRLKKISEQAATEKGAPGTASQQIGDLWASGMDSAAIEQQGLKPLKEDLDAIAAIRSREDLLKESAALHQKSINSLFFDGVGQDDKNSDQMAYQLGQGGLGMPNR
ncbi:MAG TPA: M13 family metallopeptidase N-terminal domain-containing protein, partial [Puia sp.]|nr:M13 family metallopeptidase N-terminal domain-containing protein [Puia sp.]